MNGAAASGLDLAEAFYSRVVASLIRAPHAACLLGEGSEVLGYDTARSRDHDFGPRLRVFVNAVDVDEVKDRVTAHLPRDFDGLATTWRSTASGTVEHHVVVTTLQDWLEQSLGLDPREGMDAAAWLALPQQRLLQVTRGRVLHDYDGELGRVRELVRYYPDEVWAWLMRCGWHLIGVAEPMRGRCLEVGDDVGARLLSARLCRLVMEMCFLQERRYWPYGKWFAADFARLQAAGAVTPLLTTAMTGDSRAGTGALRRALLLMGQGHNRLGLGERVEPHTTAFHVGINDAVRPYEVSNARDFVDALRQVAGPSSLRLLEHVGAIDQLTHSDDVMVDYTDWPVRLEREYRALLRGDGG